MAAFTTIAAATVAVGGAAGKGFLAGDAAKDAARAAGRLEIEQERLEQESIARLEQNFYDAIRATTDIYDKQLQMSNVQGSQILEAAQEGDQRGVAATAGKVKQVQDATTGAIADKFAEQKMKIDMKRAEASETDAARIASLFDDRAAAAGLEAKAKRNEQAQLEGAATGAFIDAGVAGLTAAIGAFGGAEGKAAQGLVDSGEAANLTDATKMVDGLGNKALRQIGKSGTMSGLASSAGSDIGAPIITKAGDVIKPLTPEIGFDLSGGKPLQMIGYENVNKSGGFGQELMGALAGLKNTAGQIANIKNQTSSLNDNLASNENVEAATKDPMGLMKLLGFDFSQFFNK